MIEDYKTEVWKAVKDYEQIYEVSNMGRVRNIKTGRVLRHSTCFGYPLLILHKDNKPKRFLLHRLVAEAFCERNETEKFVLHKDKNKLNCRAINLEWVTALKKYWFSEDSFKNISRKAIRVRQLTLDGSFVAEYPSCSSAAKAVGCTMQNLYRVLNNISGSRTAFGFIWERVN